MTPGGKKRHGPMAWVLAALGGTVLITVLLIAGVTIFDLFKKDPAGAIAELAAGTDDYLVFPGSRAGDLPDWVPVYRKAENVEAVYTARTGEGTSGTVKYETIVSAEILLGFYRNWLVEQQYQFQENDAVQSADSAYFSLLGEDEKSGRSINMGIVEYQGRTKVTLNHMATAD